MHKLSHIVISVNSTRHNNSLIVSSVKCVYGGMIIIVGSLVNVLEVGYKLLHFIYS